MATRYYDPPQDAAGMVEYYDKGKQYNDSDEIDLTNTVEVNRNFYIGDQWRDRDSSGLTPAVLNFIKPTIQIKISAIMSEQVAFVVRPAGIPGATEKHMEVAAAVLTNELNRIWEKQALTSKIRKIATNAAIDGDGCWHTFWNPTAPVASVDPNLLKERANDVMAAQGAPQDGMIPQGMDMGMGENLLSQGMPQDMGGMRLQPEVEQQQDQEPQVVPEGDIQVEPLYNTRVFFGNSSSPDVQEQPYILIANREYVPKVKKRAKENGVSDEIVNGIEGAADTYFGDDQDDRITILTLYYRDEETGTIWSMESTENAILREPEDTGLSMYPVAWLPWEERYNSYHGYAAVTELVYNQWLANILATMATASVTRSAFPTVVYDKNVIEEYDNAVGAAIGVSGVYTNMDNVIHVVEGANYGYQVDKLLDYFIATTRSLNGANDVVMGDIKPENTSAIIAARKAATTPLELVRAGLYKFVEDYARIAIDFMRNYYGVRPVAYFDEAMGQEIISDFDFDKINVAAFDLRIDVGGSSYWSEQTEVQTLDNLFNKNMIWATDYVETMPATALPHKAKLLENLRKREEEQKALQQQQMIQQTARGSGTQPGATRTDAIAPTAADLAGAVPQDRINQVLSRQST